MKTSPQQIQKNDAVKSPEIGKLYYLFLKPGHTNSFYFLDEDDTKELGSGIPVYGRYIYGKDSILFQLMKFLLIKGAGL